MKVKSELCVKLDKISIELTYSKSVKLYKKVTQLKTIKSCKIFNMKIIETKFGKFCARVRRPPYLFSVIVFIYHG